MAQLETPTNLDKLADPRWRLLFPLPIQTGLRINDALHLPHDCVARDHHQAPYLRYHNRKMKREALMPIWPKWPPQSANQPSGYAPTTRHWPSWFLGRLATSTACTPRPRSSSS